jgi:hypothetical protein
MKFKVKSVAVDGESSLGAFDRMKLAELRKWLSKATIEMEEIK